MTLKSPLAIVLAAIFTLALPIAVNAQSPNKQSSDITFTQSQLKTDFKITHSIKTADVLGLGTKQLIVFGEDAQNKRLLVIYEILIEERNYSEVTRKLIPDNFIAFDILKSQKGHKLIFQTNSELIEYVATKNSFQTITTINSIYLQDTSPFLIEKEFSQDLTGDKLDDIAVADFHGLHLYIQTINGSFQHQTAPILPEMESDNSQVTYTERKLYFGDMNLDSKQDLIIVKDSVLSIYPQNGHNNFLLESYDMKLPIDVKSLDWWKIKQSDGESLDQSKLSHRSMFDIVDLNGDGLSDLIVRFSQTEGVLDRQNNYEIYLGKSKQQQLYYHKIPDSIIKAEGTISSVEAIDLDNDNKLEILVSSLDIGISQIIGALLSGSIDQDVYLFKMDENDIYSDEPMVEKEVDLNFSLSSGKSDNPVIKLADFDGDGLKDLLFSDGEKALKTYQGVNTKKLFQKRASKHKVILPENGQLLEVSDLNNDTKQDIIIRYGRHNNDEFNNKLVFLFSQ